MNHRVSSICLILFITATSIFAQEVSVSPWGYGFETGIGVVKKYEKNYSISFQSWHRYGSGWSVDWISRNNKINNDENYFAGIKFGILGSLYLGFPLGKIIRPYAGGGIGIGFTGFENRFFSWKAGAGMQIWFFDSFYLTTGYTYDNIREHSISIGIGLKFKKNVTSFYMNTDGSKFQRTWDRFIWESNVTPERIYEDNFLESMTIDRYQKTTNYTTRENYSGGNYMSTEGSGVSGNPLTGGRLITYYSVYEITVTRELFTRSWYYKNSPPTAEIVYKDTESSVLVDTYYTT